MGENGDRVSVTEVRDATMMDVGDGSRPPGDPPDGTEWVRKVTGFMTGGRPSPEAILGNDFVSERMRLEFPDGEDGEPVITIEEEVLEAMNGLWKQCLIVRVLGRNVAIQVLSKKLREMWKPKGWMTVTDLPRQYYLIRFEKEEEFLEALTGGPWKMFGSYLLVKRWSLDFNPMSDEIATTPVWVRLSNIPVNFYHQAILFGIAKGLGTPVKVDTTTRQFERARFARVCVEIDLSKTLKGSVLVNGNRYFVSYEGLTNICSGCGIYGHAVHNCPKRVVEEAMVNAVEEVAAKTPRFTPIVTRPQTQDEDGYTVVRRGRRSQPPVKQITFSAGVPQENHQRNLREISGQEIRRNMEDSNKVPNLDKEVNISVSNPFKLLEEDGNIAISAERQEDIEGNKENVLTRSDSKIGRSDAQAREGRVIGSIGKETGPFREGPHEKNPGRNNKSGSGPKIKSRITKPTRGLVFGQKGSEVELSSSGKRMRVENDSAGRPGGSFNVSGQEKKADSDGLATSIGGEVKSMEESGDGEQRNMEIVTVVDPLVGSACDGSSAAIRYMLKKFKSDILALFETHAEGDRAQRICRGLGFDNSFRVDAIGQSGGIWLLWREEVGSVEIVKASSQFIHTRITKDAEVVHLIVVYAAPTVSRRSGLWNELRDEMQNVTEPVVVGGDFNTIVRLDERSGGNGMLSADSVAFGEWMSELSLIDMGFRGGKFTWRRGRETRTFVAKRLDRVLCCASARLRWQEAVITHLPFFSSDHAPLYLQLTPEVRGDPRRRPFRFEAAWLQHEGFKELLTSSWNNRLTTPAALELLRVKLRKWNKEVFGDVKNKKEKLMKDIETIQNQLEITQTDDLLRKEEELLKEFEVVLEQEEMIWFQKSREKVIAHGDRNTKFFHTSTIIRRRRNRIEALKGDDGVWIADAKELETLALDYYRRLYSMEDVDDIVDRLPTEGFTPLAAADLGFLQRDFTAAEVEGALRSMGSYKAPGPDGFQPVFYQKCWETVGESVVQFVLNFFESGELPVTLNDALVVLIPKVGKPEKVTQFRPISLCNVLFKSITKAMVVRLKGIISLLIGPAQSSFIPGRLSTDNIVIVQEAVHSMRRKKGRKGWMLLKLDLEKAYDRIRWDFLEDTLRAARFPENWILWIMRCVTGPSMNLLWNGEKTDAFKPARGLRQGDPLSPYLFVLCLERLCHLIDRAVGSKEWKPITLSRGGPQLSHICFADDLILFAEASVSQIKVIRKILERFCVASEEDKQNHVWCRVGESKFTTSRMERESFKLGRTDYND
ncbi:Reverse transcriptase domain [Arabidopsis suecica]|uniref:Reverse transcriptase domain n=1 Tax=Arabidopsis suecica TaxID=45249 RepID=A0A8T1XWQ0_ARASU|nr:Reverse transcriptase domain [Arabidopsis suecica]